MDPSEGPLQPQGVFKEREREWPECRQGQTGHHLSHSHKSLRDEHRASLPSTTDEETEGQSGQVTQSQGASIRANVSLTFMPVLTLLNTTFLLLGVKIQETGC